MAAACYLRRTGRRYFFRRRVPAGIRPRLCRAEVVKGLGPCTFTEAGRRALRLAAAADELFATVERDDTLIPDQVDALARDYFERLVCADEHRLCHFRPEDEADVRREVDRTRREREGYRELLRINDWEVAGEVVDHLLAEAGIEATVGETAYRDLCRKVFRALTEAARLQLAKLHGEYGIEPRDPLFKQRSRPTTEAEPERPAARVAEAAPLLGELVAAHLEAMARAWTPQTRHQNAATLRLFLDHLGDRPVDGIARRDVSAFLDALAKLPSKYGQQRPFRGKGLKEMLALAEAVARTAAVAQDAQPPRQRAQRPIHLGPRPRPLGRGEPGLRLRRQARRGRGRRRGRAAAAALAARGAGAAVRLARLDRLPGRPAALDARGASLTVS